MVLVLGIAGWLYQRPLPAVSAEVVIPQSTSTTSVDLPWPTYGQAAIGAVGYGVLEKNNASTPVPIASITKAITALAILEEKPLQAGQSGPLITITERDLQLYRDYLAQNGSVLPFNAGAQVSQYQLLQAMMLPSANNIADTAAIWAFGSLNNYVNFANLFVKELGMKQTTVADASGFSPQSTSTAEDLVLLGNAALQNPLLAEIINQKEAVFPGVGIAHNVNHLLGVDGIIGIKTGNTDQAGGCYLFGAKRTVAGQPVTVIGAVLGAPTRNIAMEDSRKLIQSVDAGFELITAVRKNQEVGHYEMPWGASVTAVSANELRVLKWKGDPLVTDTDLSSLMSPKNQGVKVGSIKAQNGDSSKSVSVVLAEPVSEPSLTWRIFR
jgi:D-alanyl-D-alanine carboxypeptidase (penicillin-binding protein 5/6)